MTGVTSLRPLTNDPAGPQKQKNGNLDDHSPTTPNAHGSDIVKAKGMYVRDSKNKPIAENDKYRDDETVKTANSSTINTNSTIETEILYDNDDDDQSKNQGVTEWIPVTSKNSKRKQSLLTATAPEENVTPVKTLIKNRGDKMIDTTEMLITPVKIEFLLSDKKTFNLRSEFTKLFQCMQKVDSSLAILTNDAA